MIMAGRKNNREKRAKQKDQLRDLESWNEKFSQKKMQMERKRKLWKESYEVQRIKLGDLFTSKMAIPEGGYGANGGKK